MEYTEFTQSVTELFEFFRYRPPSETQMEIWFRKTKHLPGESLRWSLNLIETFDTMPRNIPKAFIRAWEAWLQEHPDKKAPKSVNNPDIDCPDCIDGIIYVERYAETGPQTAAFRCSKCRRSSSNGIPMASLKELQSHGWQRQKLGGVQSLKIGDCRKGSHFFAG